MRDSAAERVYEGEVARPWLSTFALVPAVMAVTLSAARAQTPPPQSPCEEHGLTVGLTAGIGVAAGAVGALTVAGILVAADDTRDFDFGVGAGVGIGVTAGLAGIYTAVDLATNCQMAAESGSPVIWSIPIVLFVVGAALPAAVWGASDEVTAESAAALHAAPAPGGLTVRF
jgi:hypothetical protein